MPRSDQNIRNLVNANRDPTRRWSLSKNADQEPIMKTYRIHKYLQINILKLLIATHHRNAAARPKRILPCKKWGKLPMRPAQADVVLCWLSDASPANANVGCVPAGARHASSGVVSGATAEQSAVALVI
jgi:hypothetical protein